MAFKNNRKHVNISIEEQNPQSKLVIRKGRVGRVPSVKSFSGSALRSRHALISFAHSPATYANVALAEKVLKQYTTLKNAPDPVKVTNSSSDLIINLLADYCGFGTKHALKNNTMGALVQGLRIVYSKHGHYQSWYVNTHGGAQRNPLINNPDIERLRKAHRVHLARNGTFNIRGLPNTINNICDIAERFWYGNRNTPAPFDIALHAILVLGIHLGLRYDGMSKLKLENVTVGSGGDRLTMHESIKNSTVQRDYVLREWDGNSGLRHSVLLDPFLALFAWLAVLGAANGYLFCGIRENNHCTVLNQSNPWHVKHFTNHFRSRLSEVGVGQGDLSCYSGHSMKRGCVQLYRSLGVRDEMIMQLIQMSGPNAYHNYCAAYNDCAPADLPRFASVQDFLRHAETINLEENQHEHDAGVLEWY